MCIRVYILCVPGLYVNSTLDNVDLVVMRLPTTACELKEPAFVELSYVCHYTAMERAESVVMRLPTTACELKEPAFYYRTVTHCGT